MISRSWKDLKVLALGAHPDDIEVGCAGLLLKYKDLLQIRAAIFSDRMDDGTLRDLDELDQSIDILGFPRDDFEVFDIPTRIFHDNRPQIRTILLDLKNKYQPDIIFCPAIHDIHQDHITLAEETIRILREKTIFGYEVLRSGYGFQPQLFVSLTRDIVETKIRAAQCYRSQFTTTESGGFYFDSDVMRGLMFARGGQFGFRYAEALEIYHLKL